MSNWVENLKVGDGVIVSRGEDSIQLKKVDKITKTMIVLNDNQRFRITNGNLVGGSVWSTTSLLQATDERIHAIAIRNKRIRLSRIDWAEIDDETIQQVFSLVKGKLK